LPRLMACEMAGSGLEVGVRGGPLNAWDPESEQASVYVVRSTQDFVKVTCYLPNKLPIN
jgi:hypothetical protein